MGFWDFESRQERLSRDARTFTGQARRQLFERMAADRLRERGMDPDLLPSLSPRLDADASGRAQASGVSARQYQGATPQQRSALASARGKEYTKRIERRTELHEQGYSDEQIDIWDRVHVRASELVPPEIEAPHYDERGAIVKGGTYDEEFEKATGAAIKELGWNEMKALSPGGGILESFGRLFGKIEALDPAIAGPLARTTEGFPVPDPEGRTQFERGAEMAEPAAEAILSGVSKPFEAGELGFEAATGIRSRGVSGAIEGEVSKDILSEVINPAAIVLVAPLAGQGIKLGQMSTRMIASKLVSNLLATGMEPEGIPKALRALNAARRAGPGAIKGLPAGTKRLIDDLGGFAQRRAGERPAAPTFREYETHVDEMTASVGRNEKTVKYIKEEVAANRMDTRAADEATVRLSDARGNLRTAKKDLNTARYRSARAELLDAARANGIHDENILNMLGDAFDNSVARVPVEEMLMNAGATRHWLANAAAHITGTPPGVVGRLAHHRDILLSAMRRYSTETVHPVFKELQGILKAEVGNIRFIGPKKWVRLAEGEYKLHHIIQHPEWFEGMSPALRSQMDKAQEVMRTRLDTAKALGYPIEALDAAYLEQLWELPTQAVGSAYMPGRVSVAKPKLFDDYFMGLTQGYTPKAMSVEELMQHSTGLLDQAISDAWMKQEIVRRFGTKHGGKVIQGKVRFGHALYKDWHGPAEISSWLDEMEAPVGKRLAQAANVSAAFRGTVFGLTDIAVAGVQFPLALGHGGMQIGVGTLNRSLQQLGLPYMHLYLQDEKYLSRWTQAASDGLHVSTGPASVRIGGGTVLQYIPELGKFVDAPVSKAIDIATQAQFGYALGHVRMRMFEGNLVALKMTGENIMDKGIRRMAADWANSATGASRGPMIKGHKAAWSIALTSVQMTRANLSVYGQLAKTVAGIATGKVSKLDGLRAVMTLANLGAYTYGVQYLFNEVFGDGPMQWVPGRSDWATIRIGGRTVPIIPQRSILRGIDKSVKILAEEVGLTGDDRYSISDLAAAWAQVAVGKASPLAAIVPGLAGYGFEPGTGKFEMGELSAEGRIVGALPIPPLLEQAGWQERDELSLAIAGLGFNPYDTSSGVLLREEFKNRTEEELNWESPAHREIIDEDSRLAHLWEKSRSESREYGSEDAITSEEVRQEIAEAEEVKGVVRLAEAILAGDSFAAANWSEARSEFLIWRSGKWDTKLTGREPKTEIGRLVNELFALNPKSEEFTDFSGVTDWGAFNEAQDAVKAQMSKADREAIENNEKFTNPLAEKVDEQFREATDKLRPFWDVEDETWSRLRRAHQALRPYASLAELEKTKATELAKMFPQEEIRWRLNRVTIVSEVRSVIGSMRMDYRRKHPEIDALLVKWYGNTPVEAQQGGRPTRPQRPSRPGR